MKGFLYRELFIVDEDVGIGASRLWGEIGISKEKKKITPCLNC